MVKTRRQKRQSKWFVIWRREGNRDCRGRTKDSSDRDPGSYGLVASGLSVCSTQAKLKYVAQYADGDRSTDLLSKKQSKLGIRR